MHHNQSKQKNILLSGFTILLLFISTGLWGQQTTNIQFDVDIAVLSAPEKARLIELFKTDLANAISIELIGHTDADGSDAYNEALSKRRVEYVRKQLIDLGYPADKIAIAYKGEKNPLNANKNGTDKAQNRRVEILWQKTEPVATSTIQDLYKLLEQEKQTFCINPNRDTFLILNQGTLIFVPAGSFNTRSADCVLLKTKEIYTYSDMILENLSTTSDGRLLETAGMVYTEASDQDGNAIYLNKGAEITIMVPTDTLRADMQLFTGERIPESNQMNWSLAPNQSQFSSINFNHDLDWCNPIDYQTPTPSCVKCGLFCRIGRFGNTIKGATNDEIRAANKAFRKCQKSLKAKKKQNAVEPNPYPFYCYELMQQYGVTTPEALHDTLQRIQEAIMKAEFDKYGVNTMEEYKDTLRKIELKRLEEMEKKAGERLKDGTGSTQDLLYYVARVNTMGWINCDAFVSFPDNLKIDMLTDVPATQDYDCKLVFREIRSIMRPNQLNKKIAYMKIPPGKSVWLVALKYEQGQAYISMHNTLTDKNAPYTKFRPVSIEELREEMKKIND